MGKENNSEKFILISGIINILYGIIVITAELITFINGGFKDTGFFIGALCNLSTFVTGILLLYKMRDSKAFILFLILKLIFGIYYVKNNFGPTTVMEFITVLSLIIVVILNYRQKYKKVSWIFIIPVILSVVTIGLIFINAVRYNFYYTFNVGRIDFLNTLNFLVKTSYNVGVALLAASLRH